MGSPHSIAENTMNIQSVQEFMNVRAVASTANQFQALSQFCQEQAARYRNAETVSAPLAERSYLKNELNKDWSELAELYQSMARSS